MVFQTLSEVIFNSSDYCKRHNFTIFHSNIFHISNFGWGSTKVWYFISVFRWVFIVLCGWKTNPSLSTCPDYISRTIFRMSGVWESNCGLVEWDLIWEKRTYGHNYYEIPFVLQFNSLYSLTHSFFSVVPRFISFVCRQKSVFKYVLSS